MSESVPFNKGMLTEPLSSLDEVRLKGVKYNNCGSMSLGSREYCINCTSSDVENPTFSKYGEVSMHTIIRHPPPPPYPKEKFKPFPTAWVKLEDGLFISQIWFGMVGIEQLLSIQRHRSSSGNLINPFSHVRRQFSIAY